MLLNSKYNTPIALDESVLGLNDLMSLSKSAWQGFFIIKPSLIIEAENFIYWRSQCPCPLVYSTTLETAVGTAIGLSIASSDRKNSHALGFGVSNLFEEDTYSNLNTIKKIWND